VALTAAIGGRLARTMGGWRVICWALVIVALFLLIPVIYLANDSIIQAPIFAWASFGYVSLVSQLLAFFFWYQGMTMSGVIRTSQLQLLQPFMTLIVAWLLLGEVISSSMIGFALAVVATVFNLQQR
jgi:drug/metabolite transporter (DMT)-like permease